jgi:hypothetical protein
MLKVSLNRIVCINKKYVVFLDSENRFKFDDKRKAADFLRLVSKQINACLVFLNEELLELEKYYRHYFFTDCDYQLKFEIQNSIECINNRINSVLLHSGAENQNTYVIKAVEGCFFEFLTVYKTLIAMSISRCDSFTRQRLINRSHIVELFMIDFKNFEMKIHVQRSEIKLISYVKMRIVRK